MSISVRSRDLVQHMDLVSQRVFVFGMPKQEALDYIKWKRRRKKDFQDDRLLDIRFNGAKLKTITQRRLIFDTQESLLATNGTVAIVNKSITLELETDGKWRVVEERVHGWKMINIDSEDTPHGE